MQKSAEAFRTISEVSELLRTPAHVLRFWESRFSQIKPVKRAGGRRYYRPADLALLGGVKKLLHDDGLTIRGVQKILKEQGVRHVAALAPEALSSGAVPDPVASQSAAAPDRDLPAASSAATQPAVTRKPDGPFGPVERRDRTEPAPKIAAQPVPASLGEASDRLPAATMLRAMDALRAQDKKSELTSVYLRLVDLKERLARSGTSSRT